MENISRTLSRPILSLYRYLSTQHLVILPLRQVTHEHKPRKHHVGVVALAVEHLLARTGGGWRVEGLGWRV